MKIGVDGRILSKPMTGIGRYIYEMCSALSLHPEIKLYLYSPTTLRFTIKNTIIMPNLSYWTPKKDLDAFWGPAHFLPYLPKRIPGIVTIHDVVWKIAPQTMRPLSRWIESYRMPSALKRAAHVTTVSNATKDDVMRLFHVRSDRISVIPNGSNHIVPATHTNEKKPYCLFVGTLEPRKNLKNLLLAYAKLPENIKNRCNLHIAGGKGWGDLELTSLIATLHLEAHVKLLGYVDDQDLPNLYQEAQFLVMPSLYEGFGLPLIEAMACGTPVLTSNNSGMKEVAGPAGLLIDPYHIDSIKQGLIDMISNDNLRQALANQATAQAAHYHWDNSAGALINLFKKMI